MKFIALVGSLRKDSYNMQLALTIKERFAHQFELTIPNLGELPLFDQDVELDPPQTVKDFKKLVKEADGVIIITPEYNWSIPGVLKNALDWLSRVDKVLVGKPVMTAGATPGLMGTVRAQLHLRQTLSSPGLSVKLLPPAGNEIVITNAAEKFDSNKARLTDERTIQFVDEVVKRFVEFVQLESNK
jgi:chromate reductase, NAD(P)H dehydrogenase (quinone)